MPQCVSKQASRWLRRASSPKRSLSSQRLSSLDSSSRSSILSLFVWRPPSSGGYYRVFSSFGGPFPVVSNDYPPCASDPNNSRFRLSHIYAFCAPVPSPEPPTFSIYLLVHNSHSLEHPSSIGSSIIDVRCFLRVIDIFRGPQSAPAYRVLLFHVQYHRPGYHACVPLQGLPNNFDGYIGPSRTPVPVSSFYPTSIQPSSCPSPTLVEGLRDNESGLALKTTMTLRKGATFHSPTSPVSSNLDDTFVPPQLSRSQTHLDDVVDANRRRIALTLSDIDEALAKTENLSLSPNPKNKTLRDTSLPVPRGFLDPPLVDPAMAHPEPERRVLRPRSVRRSKQQASDSGLGSSIASLNEKCEAAQTSDKKDTKTLKTASALTGSGASSTKGLLPALSQKAFNRIQEHTLGPLLQKQTLKDFEPIVLDVPRKIRSKEIICLRDLEKTLIFMAPETAKSPALYLDFCLTSIRCIQATVEYLTDREQVRSGDRPYTNGYFIDLKEQIYQYGKQLAAAREKGGSGDNMDVDKEDEIRLYGGIAENGRPAELIRVRKDGSAISMATGRPVDLGEAPITFKRSLSEQREDEEEIMRSMARRKKNATAEELAPKKCREPGCNKEFKRPCDLTKHEKTHSRPWKCPIPTCKYHEFGWPTEKEMDRHVNDKHSDAPAMFECLFKPCPYKSKRESNCKQHMEKAHGWTYVRTKTNGKKLSSNPASSVQQTPPLGSVSTPSSTPTYSVPTPPQDQDAMTFPTYQSDGDWLAAYGIQPETLDGMDLTLEHTSPSSATSYEQYPPYQNGSTFILNDEDIYAAPMQLPAQLQVLDQLYNKILPQQLPVYRAPQPCPPPQLQVPPHFSPSGQENAMLFTPNSLREVDEGFDEVFNGDGSDFQLFPATSTNKGSNFQQPLFADIPSANLGFSQSSQPDFFNQADWTNLGLQPFRE